MSESDILSAACKTYEKLTSKPQNYLSVQKDVGKQLAELTKSIYDFTKGQEKPIKGCSALPKLIIQGFDAEQVWQQLELQNEDRWKQILPEVSKFLIQNVDFNIPVKIGVNVQSSSEEEEEEKDESEPEEEEEPKHVKKRREKKKKKSARNEDTSKVKGSIVDDQFFKLKELETFLNAQDKLEMNRDKKKTKRKKYEESSSEEDDDDQDIDLFADWDSNDEGIEKMDDGDDPASIKYKDFFGAGSADDDDDGSESAASDPDATADKESGFSNDSGSEQDEEEEYDQRDVHGGKDKSDKKSVRFLDQPSSDDEDDASEESNEESKTSKKKSKADTEGLSELELRQLRLGKKISHLENNMLKEKAWPMKGEVVGSTRPQNSLLEEVLDFDMTSRPAPIITEETTMKLQDIIIQRIKDKAWDDVERKIKPVQDVQEFKKQLVLDQEKSKLSLAQVYEQDYIKQRDAMDPDADDKKEEEPQEHEEIRELMAGLFAKLDALCNFHYTPKMAVPDVKIVSNMPAISMEEVAPVATSDATLLAPEEIKVKPKGDIIGKSERTETDKNRERRQKKLRQRQREQEKAKREKLLDKVKPGLGNKYSREKASKLMDKVTKARNVEKMETLGDSRSLKSSSAFFSQLQEEVSSSIKSKLKSSSKKTKQQHSAKRMKL